MSHVVGILGGMGPAAGADFVRQFVKACTDRLDALGLDARDQAYPEHWLAQVPVADRTAALLHHSDGQASPLNQMSQALRKFRLLGACSVALACNTAHAWHGELQQAYPDIEVLHIVKELASHLQRSQTRAIGLLATTGTHASGLYARPLAELNVVCHLPSAHDQALLMCGIYDGVKAGNWALAREVFGKVSQTLCIQHGIDTVVMGCTEIPLALSSVPGFPQVELLDPSVILARALAIRAILDPAADA